MLTNPFSIVLTVAFFNLIIHLNPLYAQSIEGELRQYHKITLTFDGPELAEAPETFFDYRMNITFRSPSSKEYIVPGYFAADGNAAESSAREGHKWRCHITPGEAGEWSYTVSFRTGTYVAVSLDVAAGSPTSIDGEEGTFTVGKTDKEGMADFRAKGKLQYTGERFARFDNGEYYFEVGADSPETFLQYDDFDRTATMHDYAEVASYYEEGDPGWQDGKGTEIIGAVNYLAARGMNVHYFLTMNITGDGDGAFPFHARRYFTTYDVSRLEQWQVVFDHMYNKGIVLEMVLTETENSNWFEFREGIPATAFARSRKLYYREMIARFGYLNIIYNVGEEANWLSGGDVYTAAQVEEAAAYIGALSPFADLISVHNGPSDDFSLYPELTALPGMSALTAISLQGDYEKETHGYDQLLKLHRLAGEDNTTWVCRYSEPYSSTKPDVEVWTDNSLWSSIMAGSAGIHYYSYNGDVTNDDYTEYSMFYERMRYAHEFFRNNDIPFWNFTDYSDAIRSGGYLSADGNGHYMVFLPAGETASIDLEGADQFDVKWFDPRSGGDLQNGSLTSVTSGDDVSVGEPPYDAGKSWVVLLKGIETTTVPDDSDDPGDADDSDESDNANNSDGSDDSDGSDNTDGSGSDNADEPDKPNEANDTDNPSDPVLSTDARDTRKVSVFPNPVSAAFSQIVLSGIKPGHYTVELRDVHGRSLRIDEKTFRHDRESIRMGSINPGVYLLKLYGSNASYIVKVQVIH